MSKIKTIGELKEAMKYASFQLYVNMPDQPQRIFNPQDVVEFCEELQNKMVTLAHLIADKTARGEIK